MHVITSLTDDFDNNDDDVIHLMLSAPRLLILRTFSQFIETIENSIE